MAVILAPHMHVNFSVKEIAWPKETTVRDHQTTNKTVARCLQHFKLRFQKYINNLVTKLINIYIFLSFGTVKHWSTEERWLKILTLFSHSVIPVNDTYVHKTGAQRTPNSGHTIYHTDRFPDVFFFVVVRDKSMEGDTKKVGVRWSLGSQKRGKSLWRKGGANLIKKLKR